MTTRTIEISESQSAEIDALVADGILVNPSDIVTAGLRAAQQHKAKRDKKLKALLDAAQVGIDDIEAGRCTRLNSPAEIEAFIQKCFNQGVEEARGDKRHRAKPAKAA